MRSDESMGLEIIYSLKANKTSNGKRSGWKAKVFQIFKKKEAGRG
jgi:hypothetical protein